MPKVKIARKSTWVDMTAFVDVAFLILSFFMLATKFKPDEAMTVKTPTSVSKQILAEQNSCLVLVDGSGRVFVQLTDTATKKDVINQVLDDKGLVLDGKAKSILYKQTNIGSSVNDFLTDVTNQSKPASWKGVPTDTDSLGGELKDWIGSVKKNDLESKFKYYVKCDVNTQYYKFKQVIEAFRSNDIYTFDLVTNPEDVPIGSDLDKANIEMSRLNNQKK